jgi:hypothetical protein
MLGSLFQTNGQRKTAKAWIMRDNQSNGLSGLLILALAMIVCCLAPILFLSVSFGSFSLLSGLGTYLSIGIAALAGVLAMYLFRKEKNSS